LGKGIIEENDRKGKRWGWVSLRGIENLGLFPYNISVGGKKIAL
jgi:hypothetical protein